MSALLPCCSFVIHRKGFFYPSIYSWIEGICIISGDVIHDCTVRSYCFIREANYASGKYAGQITFHLEGYSMFNMSAQKPDKFGIFFLFDSFLMH